MVKKVGHIYSITNIVCTAFIGGGHIIAERNLLQCEMLAPPPSYSKYGQRGQDKYPHFHWISCVCKWPHNTFYK